MFTTLIVQPLFNLLVAIYAIIPGHNFGLAIIIFTVLVRWAMLPLLKKQLRNTLAMRSLQPELKRIKKAAAGNKQTESMMVMELYKERGINPFGAIGLLIVQLPLFIALYSGLQRIVKDPNSILNFSYSWLQDLPWMKTLAADISKFDNTLFGLVDLGRTAVEKAGGVYWAAMIVVAGSALVQWLQIRQTMPHDPEARKLRHILRDAKTGEQPDTSEVNAAMGRNMSFFMPIFIFMITVGIAAAMSLYWLVSGLVAYIQQAYLLKQDEYQLEAIANSKTATGGCKARSGVTTTIITSEAKTSGPKKAVATSSSKNSKNQKHKKRRR